MQKSTIYFVGPGESAHSKKTRIETVKENNRQLSKSLWKRPFQENKDWNSTTINLLLLSESGESAHSKKTRIETWIDPWEAMIA